MASKMYEKQTDFKIVELSLCEKTRQSTKCLHYKLISACNIHFNQFMIVIYIFELNSDYARIMREPILKARFKNPKT